MAEQRLGLALSGGGFRASLFHIGLLARLAELDKLRRVEVISTVSGGSILGACYYLKVKQLLEGKHRDFPKPCRAAYVQIVKEIEEAFLAAVQKNLRMRALCNPYKNARMFLSDDYSRSDRMSELYDEYFYLPIWRAMRKTGPDILLEDIKIHPDGQPAGFDLAAYNAAAEYKIPNLVINATSLNTGHSWHFTGSWVGEPDPTRANAKTIDTNYRCTQLRFDEVGRTPIEKRWPDLDTPEQKRKRDAMLKSLTLADAVAASACVPGLFTPMAIPDLYWSKKGQEIVVELVDGGVFDNQGIDALYGLDCTEIVCSDAAGQLEDEVAPSSWAISVAMRSNGVMMDRLRDDGYYDLYYNQKGGSLARDPACAKAPLAAELQKEWEIEKFAFFHLRECFKPQLPDYPAIPGPRNRATTDTGHVYRLSNIRTDLDSFSDIEAYSLMYDGYCRGNEALFESGITEEGSLPALKDGRGEWKFLEIRQMLEPARLRELLKHLEVGAQQFFKVFRLGNPWAIGIAIILALALLAVAACFWDLPFGIPSIRFTVGGVVGTLLVVAALWILKKLESTHWMGWALEKIRLARRRQWLALLYAALGVVLIIVWAAVTIHMLVFDPLFLSSGKIRRRS